MINGTADIQDEHIVLHFEYDLDTIDIVRDITGREWDKTERVWKLPATPWHAHEVMTRLKKFSVSPDIRELSKGERVLPRLRFPDGLYDFQKDGVKFIIRANGRCIVADEMGLGKTIEALAYVKMFGGKTLIVSPANVVYKWRDECEKWIPDRPCVVIRAGDSAIPADADVIIMSYAIMTLQYEQLVKIPFDVGIWDEAHYLKNMKAQRTRVAKSIITAGLPKVLFLSGTPFMNEPSELFSLLHMIDPLGFRNYWEYAKKYCGAMSIDGHFIIPKHVVTNVDELTHRLERYMVRRTKKDVALELPDLTRTYMPVEIANMSAYLKATRDVTEWLNSKGKTVKSKAHVLTKLGILRQIVGEGKVDAAVELANNILDEGRKVVLFAHHKSTVDMLSRKLIKKGLLVIDGSTPSEERQKNSNLFLMSNSKFHVMIMSVAGAEGIDMYSASDIIFVEREWTPAKEEQAEARLHRLGQKNTVNAWYIVAAGTIDEKMNRLIQTKRGVIGQVIHQDEILEALVEELKDGNN